MSTVSNTLFLRRVLLADALTCAATGALMALGADPLATWTGLPSALLRVAGVALLPWAAFVAWLARRPALPAAAVGLVIGMNLLWVADCAWVALGGVFALTPLGLAFAGVQALAVLVLTDLQFFGLRRARRLAA